MISDVEHLFMCLLAIFMSSLENVYSGPLPIFFFQAEDGIRDVAVTGVQTCALPISEQLSLWATTTESAL